MYIVKRVVPLNLLINLFALFCLAEQKTEKLPEGFVHVDEIIPEIENRSQCKSLNIPTLQS